jgi:hypothetical protein
MTSNWKEAAIQQKDEGSITVADDSGCVSVDENLICRGVSMIVNGQGTERDMLRMTAPST